jgi:hypothetical protein
MSAYRWRDLRLQANTVSNHSAYKSASSLFGQFGGCSLDSLIAMLATVLAE